MERQKKWGGARPGAGRPASGFTERITLEVTPLMKDSIESEVNRCGKPRNEVLRYLLGMQLGVGHKMEWDNQQNVYKGVTIEGRRVVVDGDEFAEALQQAKRDGVNTDEIYSTSMWEELIGSNDNVQYES